MVFLTTFRKLVLLPSSGKKGGRGGTYSVGSLRNSESQSLDQWTMDIVHKQDSSLGLNVKVIMKQRGVVRL
jgi:hypothetical protein